VIYVVCILKIIHITNTILFAGCGGGYDVFGCVPLLHDYLHDKNVSKQSYG
jgi:hypothetical protein